MNKKSLQLFIFFLLLFCLPTEIQPAAQSPWDFSLFDADGQRHTADEWKGARAVVLLFLATECPISNRYAPDLKRLVADYGDQGVAFYGVHSDPDIGAAAVGQHAREYGLSFPMLMDPTQVLADRTGVTLTPTAVILSSAGELLYRGRIDNRNLDYGRYRNSGIKADLRLALEATLAGRTIAEPITKPIGCALPPPERDHRKNHKS
ncbi:MAG: redoxin domain-containing protein [Blastocatellia bacterium]|nr:redoxin domain-containing protein [Blastocatellia bacterium]